MKDTKNLTVEEIANLKMNHFMIKILLCQAFLDHVEDDTNQEKLMIWLALEKKMQECKKLHRKSIINRTTKRLLTASRLGVGFDYGDGHRWVFFNSALEDDSLEDKLEEKGLKVNGKVYGSIIDALNYVDLILSKVGMSSLEDQFNSYNDWSFDLDSMDWENASTETAEYHQDRIKKI